MCAITRHLIHVHCLAEERARKQPVNNINVQGLGSTSKVLAKLNPSSATALEKSDKATTTSSSTTPKKPNTPYNAAHFSTGRAAASFTSTSMTPVTVNESALIDEDFFMYKRIRKNGYARLITNFGNINLELYCEKAPRACHNFVLLAKSGYYNNTVFHRSIKNFMVSEEEECFMH